MSVRIALVDGEVPGWIDHSGTDVKKIVADWMRYAGTEIAGVPCFLVPMHVWYVDVRSLLAFWDAVEEATQGIAKDAIWRIYRLHDARESNFDRGGYRLVGEHLTRDEIKGRLS